MSRNTLGLILWKKSEKNSKDQQRSIFLREGCFDSLSYQVLVYSRLSRMTSPVTKTDGLFVSSYRVEQRGKTKRAKNPKISKTFWWVLVGCDGVWWILIGSDGFWWVLMGFDDSFCFFYKKETITIHWVFSQLRLSLLCERGLRSRG